MLAGKPLEHVYEQDDICCREFSWYSTHHMARSDLLRRLHRRHKGVLLSGITQNIPPPLVRTDAVSCPATQDNCCTPHNAGMWQVFVPASRADSDVDGGGRGGGSRKRRRAVAEDGKTVSSIYEDIIRPGVCQEQHRYQLSATSTSMLKYLLALSERCLWCTRGSRLMTPEI